MGSEVRPHDDGAGFGPWPGERPGFREDGWSQDTGWPEENGWPGENAEPGPARRRFLALAGAAAGAVPLSGMLARSPRGPGSPQAGPGTGDWDALRRALSTHKLIRPGMRVYSTSKELFDPRFDWKRPAGIAYCASPGDVSACLAFVRKFGLPVAARSGGHGYAGWSSTSGLMVDVTAMNSFQVGKGQTVRVGTGLHLIDLYNRLAAHGLAVPGGSCPTVGVAGLTLGGGVGVLSRAYGLTSDALESVQLVTADGTVRTCSTSSNSDLFWACRGGGGGNFGIATAFTFRTHRLSRLVVFFLSWPWSQAARVVAGWQSWAPYQPDALWSNLHMSAAPHGGTPVIQVGGTYLGSVDGCKRLLRVLYARVGSAPSGTPFVGEKTYKQAMMLEAGCANLSVSECHLPSQTPNGRLVRVPSYAKSDFFTRKIPPAGIRALVAGIERMRGVRGAAGGIGAIAFDAFGGALNRPSPSSTAFVHRNALFLAQYSTSWNEGGSARGVGRQHDWLRSFYASMRLWASGQCYQNYVDPDLANWRQAYYGANYARLARIKKAYDPARVFRFPQGITPA
ncbi:MAG TPA: FAD-binding oxidoreductase [Streptosporangiaceae bacterium]